jgi:hypothetical protein
MRIPDKEFDKIGKIDELVIKVLDKMRELSRDIKKLPIEFVPNQQHFQKALNAFREGRVQLNLCIYPAEDAVKHRDEEDHG